MNVKGKEEVEWTAEPAEIFNFQFYSLIFVGHHHSRQPPITQTRKLRNQKVTSGETCFAFGIASKATACNWRQRQALPPHCYSRPTAVNFGIDILPNLSQAAVGSAINQLVWSGLALNRESLFLKSRLLTAAITAAAACPFLQLKN